MKIKQDFVTNSSSTSFIFIFKGDKIDFYKTLINHKKEFNISDSDYSRINVWDIIRSIDSVIISGESDLWIKVPIEDIEEFIKKYSEHLLYLENGIKNKGPKNQFDQWEIEEMKKIEDNIELLNKCKNKGLNSVIEIGFGDNDGHIQGGIVGTVMDYEGRNINIESEDLVLFTEQNR
jgi:hypothetical protein